MVTAVEERKNKFIRYKNLRENPVKVLNGIGKSASDTGKAKEAYTARDRIRDIADRDSFAEFDDKFAETDPLEFEGYTDKKEALRDETGLHDAVLSGTCTVGGYPAVLAVMDKRFMMASMGIEVGEKISRAAEYAMEHELPLIIFTASGGARMQEGILALMQMAKTSAVIERFKEAGGLYISVLTHPTTGGVSASFATLGDITLAEPGALIGFAGPRVIEQTIGEKLPEGFQRAEFLEEHGFVDQVVPRAGMKEALTILLKLHSKESI